MLQVLQILQVLSSLTLIVPATIIIAFAASVDQDQAAQNVQPDLRSTLSAMLDHYMRKMSRNLPISLSCSSIKAYIRFISCFKG